MARANEERPKLEQARRIWRVARIIQGDKSAPPVARKRPPPQGGPPPQAA